MVAVGFMRDKLLNFRFSGKHRTCVVGGYGKLLELGLGLGFLLDKLLNFRFSGTRPNL